MSAPQPAPDEALPPCNYCHQHHCPHHPTSGPHTPHATLARLESAAAAYAEILAYGAECNPGKAHVVTPLVLARYERAYARIEAQMRDWLHGWYADRAMPAAVRDAVGEGRVAGAFEMVGVEEVEGEVEAARRAVWAYEAEEVVRMRESKEA